MDNGYADGLRKESRLLFVETEEKNDFRWEWKYKKNNFWGSLHLEKLRENIL